MKTTLLGAAIFCAGLVSLLHRKWICPEWVWMTTGVAIVVNNWKHGKDEK